MRSWDELQQASFDGIEFEFVSVRDTFGREVDRREYEGRRGAELEDREAVARELDFIAIFANEDYEAHEALLKSLDAGGIKELVHPVYGRLRGIADRTTLSHDADDAYDACTVSVHFVEHTDAAPFSTTGTTPALANAVRSSADAVVVSALAFDDALAADDGADATQASAITGAQESAAECTSLSLTLEADGDIMSAVAIQAQVNGALTRLDASVAAIADFESVEASDLGRDLVQLAADLRALAAAFLMARPPLIEVEVENEIPLLVLLHARGSSVTADEVLALNDIPDPMTLERGFKLRLYAA